jgi:hypothetical protein
LPGVFATGIMILPLRFIQLLRFRRAGEETRAYSLR